jgi:hypothetical protein
VLEGEEWNESENKRETSCNIPNLLCNHIEASDSGIAGEKVRERCKKKSRVDLLGRAWYLEDAKQIITFLICLGFIKDLGILIIVFIRRLKISILKIYHIWR